LVLAVAARLNINDPKFASLKILFLMLLAWGSFKALITGRKLFYNLSAAAAGLITGTGSPNMAFPAPAPVPPQLPTQKLPDSSKSYLWLPDWG
jgi:hypothetical protein